MDLTIPFTFYPRALPGWIAWGDDPDRRGGVKDPAGNRWWIGTQVS